MTPSLPSEAMGDSRTRVLLAVVNQSRPTVRSVAAEVGLTINVTHRYLVELRNKGLLTWDEGKQSTLRPLVEESLPSYERSTKIGSENESGPGAVRPAPDLPNAGRRR